VLAVALLSPFMTLRMVVAMVGLVKLLYTAGLLLIAARGDVLPARLAPRGLVLSAIAAGGAAWGAARLASHSPAAGTAIAVIVFGIALAMAMRFAFCIDGPVHDMLRNGAGKFGFAVNWMARC
jgi:hypothetical protein